MPVPFIEQGQLGPIRASCVPSRGFLGPVAVAENVWIVRRLFSLGAGQKAGLTWAGLRDRVLNMLGDNPLAHSALSLNNNESTKEELLEEISRVVDLVTGEPTPFPLDSSMTIVRKGDCLTLHSVVQLDAELLQAVKQLGRVTTLLAPNLQHWLFLQDWLQAFPTADLGLVPSAMNEDLKEKVTGLRWHQGRVFTLEEDDPHLLTTTGLSARLLHGAPLSLNEFVFFHKESGTLVASDSFYGGYTEKEVPTWFARLWFKLTKAGSFRTARLSVYRTARVQSHGSAARLLDCVAGWLTTWQVEQIIFAHGSSPYTAARLPADTPSPGQMYLACWQDGLAAIAE